MGDELVTGLCATRGALSPPDMTFVWDVVEARSILKVKASYGGEVFTNNTATATIPVGSTQPVTVKPAANPAITVDGTVQAAWGDNNTSYVITFSGMMVAPGVNNIFSSDKNGAPAASQQIIVAAYLSS
jgi:hypothetical protein